MLITNQVLKKWSRKTLHCHAKRYYLKVIVNTVLKMSPRAELLKVLQFVTSVQK